MSVNINNDLVNFSYAPTPIISKRAPTSRDKTYNKGLIEVGTIWIDKTLDDIYILTSVKDNAASWVGTGGGAETLSSLTVNPGNIGVTAGNLTLTAGTLTLSALGAGVVQTSGAGAIGSSKGTDGQVLVSSTAGVPAWANITSSGGSIVVTNGGNTINLEATGGTSSTFPTDSGTANPAAGATTIAGGTNLHTSAAGSTVTIDMDDSITTVAKVTAGVGLEMSSGTATITSNTNAAKAIYLHTNGGTSEKIEIHSDQGSGVDSIYMYSDVGGLTLTSGLATADAINITATDAAGGIDMDAGAAGFNIAAANGPINLISGTGAINVGADAAAHTVTVGSTTGAAATTIQTGTGALTLNSGGLMDLDAVDALSINSSTGVINVGNDAVAQNINIGTGAAARTITVGNNTGATAVDLVAGSGNVAVTVSDLEIGTAAKGIIFQEGPKIIAGAGSPAGAVTAPKGSLYLRTDGTTTNDRAYINTDASTTWTALTTAA